MKALSTLFFILFSVLSVTAQQKIYKMSKEDINTLLIKKSSENLTLTERMNFFSELFLGMNYDLNCVGDGPYAFYDTKPLLTYKATNCMVYCEDVLALSMSDSYENFFNNLQKIRYKDGIIAMKFRNHYTMADWLPENSWLLHDVAKEVAGERSKTITRTISHKNFFSGKGITDMRYVKKDRTITVNYIPFDVLHEVKEKIKDGDILALTFGKLDDIFVGHMLMAYDTPSGKVIRQSSLSKNTTFETSFDEWVKKYMNSKKYVGITLMRVNDDLNKKGEIILPWEVSILRKGK